MDGLHLGIELMVAHANIPPSPGGGRKPLRDASSSSVMPTSKDSPQTGWDTLQDKPARETYGLTFFRGKEFSVAYGILGPGLWREHADKSLKLIFTFENAGGFLEASHLDQDWMTAEEDSLPDADMIPFEDIAPGQVWSIPPRQEISLLWSRKAEIVVLFLDCAVFTDKEIAVMEVSCVDYRPFARRDPYFPQLIDIFRKLCRESNPPKADFVDGVATALVSCALDVEMIVSLYENAPQAGLPVDVMRRIDTYIDTHLREKILTRTLAKLVGFSPDHFGRRFRISTGSSPSQYVLKRKMERVWSLLETGNYNVSEAALEVGFQDLSHLNRCFRRIFGIPPKAILQRNRRRICTNNGRRRP